MSSSPYAPPMPCPLAPTHSRHALRIPYLSSTPYALHAPCPTLPTHSVCRGQCSLAMPGTDLAAAAVVGPDTKWAVLGAFAVSLRVSRRVLAYPARVSACLVACCHGAHGRVGRMDARADALLHSHARWVSASALTRGARGFRAVVRGLLPADLPLYGARSPRADVETSGAGTASGVMARHRVSPTVRSMGSSREGSRRLETAALRTKSTAKPTSALPSAATGARPRDQNDVSVMKL
eukprot:2439908-Rhodomonas_salina.1